jgi:hypothetical protein
MKDLFGHEIPEADEHRQYLREIDEQTLDARVRNLEYICSVAPEGGFVMPEETWHTFTEARDAFLNGLYVGTLLLTQAFIEHRLQMFLHQLGDPAAKRGLSAVVNRLKEVRPEYAFLLDKVNSMRRLRNPFAHLKPMGHADSITQQSVRNQMPSGRLLYLKAKESIALMNTVAATDWK